MPAEPPHLETPQIDLDPLRTHGPASLDTHDVPGLTRAKLQRLHISWPNTTCEHTVLIGEDLIPRPPAKPPSPIPIRGSYALAVFALFFGDPDHPIIVQVTPRSFSCENDAEAPRVLDWLLKRGFRHLRKLGQTTALVLLLAIAGALAPLPDDDDDTDSDPQHKIYAAAAR